MSVLRHSGTLTRVPQPKEFAEAEGFQIPWRRPETQRVRWNFLTWSFFLAQILAAQQFLVRSANAAQENESTNAASYKNDPNANLASDHLLASSASQSGAADDLEREAATFDVRGYAAGVVGLSQHTQADTSPLPGGKAGNNVTPASEPDAGTSLPSGAGGSESPPALSDAEQGGPSSFEPIPADPGTLVPGLDPLPDEIDLSDLFDTDVLGNLLDNLPGLDDVLSLDVTDWLLTEMHDAGNTVSQVLDTTLDQLTGLQLVESTWGTLDLLTESIDDALSYATGLQLVRDASGLLGETLDFGQVDGLTQLAGESLDTTLGTISGNSVVTSAIQDGESLAWSVAESVNTISNPLELTPLQHTGDLSSGGVVALVNPVQSSQLDDLFTGGRYSDYNLALQSDPVGEFANTFDSSSVVNAAASLTEALADIHPDNLLALDAHDALLANQANTLGELGERDHLI